MKSAARWASGLGTGAGLAFLFDPVSGITRRARVRDALVRGVHKGSDAAQATARDVTHRIRGVAARARSNFRDEPMDDDRLMERVRARLGRSVSHPRAIDVYAYDGRVMLRGSILADEMERLSAAVVQVPGVREVDNQLEAYVSAEGVPDLEGGLARDGDRAALRKERWAPAARLAAGTAGGALASYAVSRRGPVGIAAGVAGLGLLMRAATNRESR